MINFNIRNSETLKASNCICKGLGFKLPLGWLDIHESGATLIYTPPDHSNSIYRVWMCEEKEKISPILHHLVAEKNW